MLINICLRNTSPLTPLRYCVKTLTDHKEWIRCVRPSPDGALLASCSNDQTVRIWASANPRDCKVQAVLHGHDHVVECIAWLAPTNPQALSAITAGAGESENGSAAAHVNGGGGDGLTEEKAAAAPQILASGARDRQICIWDVKTATCLFTLVSNRPLSICHAPNYAMSIPVKYQMTFYHPLPLSDHPNACRGLWKNCPCLLY